MPPVYHHNHNKSVTKLLDFLKIYNRVESMPGFATTALGLSYTSVAQLINEEHNNLSFQQPATLRLRYPYQKLLQGGLTIDSLSTHLTLMDEVTTWAFVLADPIRSRAGVSVCLESCWGLYDPTLLLADNNKDTVVELEATVTKIGRNLGFVRAEIYNDNNKQLICYGSQIKYLPMGIVTDFALSSKAWELTKLFTNYCLKEPASHDSSAINLFDSFRWVVNPLTSVSLPLNKTIASFSASTTHASLGGRIHGGCHGVLMERTANAFVEHLNPSKKLRLESISIQYLASPPKKVGIKVAEIIPGSIENGELSLRVNLIGLEDGRIKSEGLLHYKPALAS